MSVATETKLISPHGGTLVDRSGDRPEDLGMLETITLTSRELSDLDMIASGALSPLEGFMGREDYESVLETMRLANGLPWALPVGLSSAPPRRAIGSRSSTATALRTRSSRSRTHTATTRSWRRSSRSAPPMRRTPASRGSTSKSLSTLRAA